MKTMKNIFERKPRNAYLVRCDKRIAKSVQRELKRHIGIKLVWSWEELAGNDHFTQIVARKTDEQMKDILDKVFGNMCDITVEHCVIVMEMKAA